uniref:Ras-related protein Rab-18 n=1 Tax=Zea mays TaxID=4577 RepID=B6TSE5_MAIZE|nr:ras-related protein Rab-18 [Zea mays]|eukprot:NP_001150695.1 ras-related protein Rab-18 [Zea mays]
MASSPASSYDCSFKVLLIGDSAVGKSSLLVSFVSAAHIDDDIAPTIGVDFKIKFLSVGGKKLKLTIWDTAGQERFRTITSSYYRGAHGIILVYDVTKRESFTNLADVWTKEIELHSTNKECIKMLVGNKVDKDEDRMVTKEEGLEFAQERGCLFVESSAKTRENVEKCFEELALKILQVPSLLEEGSSVVKRNTLTLKQKQENANRSGGCCQ